MSELIPMETADDHIVLLLKAGRVLLDTGSPKSFGSLDSIRVAGMEHPLERVGPYPNAPIEAISTWVGTPLVALIGGDILSAYSLSIDWRGRRVVFRKGPDRPVEHGIRMDLSHAQLPIIKINIRGAETRSYLDTGAKISYAPQSLLADLPIAGEVGDFHPAIGGRFRTQIRSAPCSVGAIQFQAEFGVLPEPLDRALAGGLAVLGSDLFKASIVELDYPREMMFVRSPGQTA